MFRLARYTKPYIFLFIILVFFVFIQVFANLQLPDYMAKIVNQGIIPQDNNIILQTGLWMLGVSLLGGIATIFVSFIASRIAAGFSRDLRKAVFSKVQNFSVQEFDKFSPASLITRSTNDIQQIQTALIMVLRMVLMAPILGVGAVIKAYSNTSSMTYLIVIPVLIMISIIVILFKVALPKFQILQSLVDKLNLVTRENLTGLRVIRAFNRQTFEEGKFDKANMDLTNVNLFVNRIMSVMQPLMLLVFNLTSIAIIWVGAHLIDSNNLQIGNMLAFMQYAMQVIMSFLLVTIAFIILPRAAVSGKRIAEVVDTESTINNPKDPKEFPNDVKGLIEFRDVSFAYPESDVPVLSDVSLMIHPGTLNAIIGSTGSGKSTLVNLIPRLYDVTSGLILVDNVDIREVKQEELHDKIGYVPQKSMLFSGTIRSNIAYTSSNADDDNVQKAAEIAQATEFINQLDKHYDYEIAQGGSNVSGGQKQRLSIARAIIKRPEIYIFDDSFSSLDFKTDAALRKALNEQTAGSTVLIVTQRITTILNADNIIVLDKGKVVGVGKHNELIQNCQVYQEIASSQLTEEELQKENAFQSIINGQEVNG